MKKTKYLTDVDGKRITVRHDPYTVEKAFNEQLGLDVKRKEINVREGEIVFVFEDNALVNPTIPQRAAAAALAQFTEDREIGLERKSEEEEHVFPSVLNEASGEQRFAAPWKLRTEDKAYQAGMLLEFFFGGKARIYRDSADPDLFCVGFTKGVGLAVVKELTHKTIDDIALLLDNFDIKSELNDERISLGDDNESDAAAAESIAAAIVGMDTMNAKLDKVLERLDAKPQAGTFTHNLADIAPHPDMAAEA